MHQYAELWQSLNAKQPEGKFGTMGRNYMALYPSWIVVVRRHCEENAAQYRPKTTLPSGYCRHARCGDSNQG
jgi:hypothetical protein